METAKDGEEEEEGGTAKGRIGDEEKERRWRMKSKDSKGGEGQIKRKTN